jgi:hypothetical protein
MIVSPAYILAAVGAVLALVGTTVDLVTGRVVGKARAGVRLVLPSYATIP